ncbi:MAG: SH3 domain-containing protein [Paraglaciecola sp.]|uniref:SH3 domain-containing protein n=1 Tax=Paraglaciecola sp. TaxID=1920173 RepID=UPI0032982563
MRYIFVSLMALSSLFVCAEESATWRSDVIGVEYAHMSPAHWLNKLKTPKKVLMQPSEIAQFNKQLVETNTHIVDPLSTPKQFSQKALLKKIEATSKVPSSARFYADGTKLGAEDFDKYTANLNKNGLKLVNDVKYAMVVSRAVMRAFPTYDRVFNQQMDTDLDRFQETGVFPGDALAVLHESADKQWYLAQHYHYLAWIPKKAVAIGNQEQILGFRDAESFVVVTGSKVTTNYVPNQPKISEVQLDMGLRLPLVSLSKTVNQIHGQNPYASYVVSLPVREDDGSLSFSQALIARHHDIHEGYLPMTNENIIAQGFKFLGERYGWGHDYNARDCTGFIGEIFKTFGLIMPRNSGQQGAGKYGINTRFSKGQSGSTKMPRVNQMQVGDLIYIPGHVMMYIGEEGGKPYVIHDVKGLGYNDAQGKFYKGTLNGVSVTPLLPLQLSAKTSYLDRVYNIKRVRLNPGN